MYLCVEGSILLPVDGSGPRGELRGKETKIYGDRTEVETRGPLVRGGKTGTKSASDFEVSVTAGLEWELPPSRVKTSGCKAL